MNTLGLRIKILREKAQMKQSELAEKVCVKDGVISNWERDKNKPDAEKLILLCEALDTNLSFLLDYYGSERQQATPAFTRSLESDISKKLPNLTDGQLESVNKRIDIYIEDNEITPEAGALEKHA